MKDVAPPRATHGIFSADGLQKVNSNTFDEPLSEGNHSFRKLQRRIFEANECSFQMVPLEYFSDQLIKSYLILYPKITVCFAKYGAYGRKNLNL